MFLSEYMTRIVLNKSVESVKKEYTQLIQIMKMSKLVNV